MATGKCNECNTNNQPSMDTLSEKLSMANLSEKLDLLKDKKLTPDQATKSIGIFTGTGDISPISFIESCQEAFKQIDISKYWEFSNIILNKIRGEASMLFHGMQANFDEIMLELKRFYILKNEQQYVDELNQQEHKIYENPMRFGWRLFKLVHYYKERNHKNNFHKGINVDDTIVERTAINTFISKVRNDKLKTALQEKNLYSMSETMDLIIKIWGSINAVYDLYPCVLMLYENYGICIYCEVNETHFRDCPFRFQLDLDKLYINQIMKGERLNSITRDKVSPLYTNVINPDIYYRILTAPVEEYESLKDSFMFKDPTFREMFEENLKKYRSLQEKCLIPVAKYNKLCRFCKIMTTSKLKARTCLKLCLRCRYLGDNITNSRLNNRRSNHIMFAEKETSKLCNKLQNLNIESSKRF